MQKAYEESKKPGTMVVMLLPARTDTSWFHDYIYDKHCEIRFIKGRLKFGGQKNPAPFPSMLVIYDYLAATHTGGQSDQTEQIPQRTKEVMRKGAGVQ